MKDKLYTDAEADIVNQFAWKIHDGLDVGYDGDLSFNGARRLLDAVAPAIAARALREASERALARMPWVDGESRVQWSDWLYAQADEIEKVTA